MIFEGTFALQVGGSFTGLGGGTGSTPRPNSGRIDADGVVDTGFKLRRATESSGRELKARRTDVPRWAVYVPQNVR